MLRILLSASQREELFQAPAAISDQDLVRHYTLSVTDLALIKSQREDHNRLGFAVQLAYFRFPGRPLQAGEKVSSRLLGYIAAQLGLPPHAFQLYALQTGSNVAVVIELLK